MRGRAFLEAVYGDLEGLWFASFGEEGIKRGYQGPDVKALSEGRNNYVTVSKGDWQVEDDGRPHRRKDYFRSFHVLLVDDVGTKLEAQDVLDGFAGYEPTFRMETSAGNETWGYVLDPPIVDPEEAWALVCRVAELFTADVKDLVKYYRLPGKNTKYQGEAGVCKLAEFGGVYYNADELRDALGAEERLPLDGGTRAPGQADESDPVLLALEEAGMLGNRRGKAKWEIACPWSDEHTGGDETGAAYLQPQGFRCHHNACEGRRYRDLVGWLRDRDLIDWGAGGLRERVEELASLSKLERRLNSRIQVGGWVKAGALGEFMQEGRIQRPPPLEMLLRGILPKRVAGIFAGPGGVGKSRIMLQICIALASGAPFGPFRPRDSKGVRVLYLNKEDDRNETWRRLWRIQQRYPDLDWKAVQRNLVVPAATPKMQLDAEGALIKAVRAGGEFELVALDPLGRLYPGVELQTAINTQEAASWIHDRLGEMIEAFACTVLGVHHVTKVGRGQGHMTPSDITGSAQLTDYARWVMQMRVMSPEDRQRAYGLRPGDPTLLTEVQVTKSNYTRLEPLPWVLETSRRGVVRLYERGRAKSKEEVFVEDLAASALEWPATKAEIEFELCMKPSASGTRYSTTKVKNLLVGAQEIGKLKMIGGRGSKKTTYHLEVEVWTEPEDYNLERTDD